MPDGVGANRRGAFSATLLTDFLTRAAVAPGRERVPPAETEDMINRAIAEAATAFGVPASSIGKGRIRIALKAGRI
jgi:hypothetical protein